MIFETFNLTASNTDMLSGGRLNAIPYGGILTMDFLSNVSTAAANFSLTIQKPNGDVPIDGQQIPGANPALDGVLDERQLLRFSFRATQGGHFTVSVVETGTAILMARIVLKP